jgi:hypothetical protein
MTVASASAPDLRFRRWALAALLVAMAYKSADLAITIAREQPLGADFSCFWAGARAALSEPSRIYDFRHITDLQGWPLGPTLRPYVYPPSALLLFAPFALLPLQPANAIWTGLTAVLFLLGARRAGAPWWVALFPVAALVAVCGQITFAVGGLVLLGLALRDRPVLAGVLFGAAAMLKPQSLVLLPIGLLAARNWRTLLGAAATAAVLLALSAIIWGPGLWLEWLAAVGRFQREVIPSLPGLTEDQISVHAWLELMGLPGALAWLLAPPAVALVWITFRRTQDPLLRAAAAFGGSLLIAPYAMHYDSALLAPGVAAMLNRTEDRLWLAYAAVGVLFVAGMLAGPLPVVAGLAPLGFELLRRRESAA